MPNTDLPPLNALLAKLRQITAQAGDDRLRQEMDTLNAGAPGLSEKLLGILEKLEQALLTGQSGKNLQAILGSNNLSLQDIRNSIIQISVKESPSLPHTLTAPPFLPEIFLGREDDLQRIHDKLFAPGGNLLLLVNGEGGVGKTSLVARYYHTYKDDYAHVAWVTSNRNLVDAVLTLDRPLGLWQDEGYRQLYTPQKLEALLTVLSNLPKPSLLVIDNANELDDLKAYYPQLQRCSNFHILFTTRISEYSAADFFKIEPLPEGIALQAFKTHYKAFEPAEEPRFRELYHAVGGNTLVLELFAKNLNHFNNRLKKRYLLEDLIRDVVEQGLLRLRQSASLDTIYQGLRKATPEEIIGAMYDISGLQKEETALLAAFAALPAERIAFETLDTLLSSEHLDTHLLHLAQKGWLDYSEEDAAFKCSPVVQEAVRRQHGDWEADCGALVRGLVRELKREKIHEDNYRYSSIYARYAETVVKLLEAPDVDLAMLCKNLGNFHMETGDLGKALRAYERMKRIQAMLLENSPEDAGFKNGLAISCEKLGQTHSELGHLEEALQFFEQYNQLEKELYEAYPNNVEFKNNLAISYSKLGSTHTALGNLDQALGYYEKDLQLTKELYEAYPNNVSYKNGLAISYSKLGSTHTTLGHLEEALQFFEDETTLFEELYEAYPNNVEFKNNLAISYNYLGNTYSALGHLEEALQFFEQSCDLIKELYEAHPNNVSFKNGVAISYQFQGRTHTALGNLDQALGYYEKYNQLEKELYEACPNNVSFKNNLAISYSKLGDTHTALGHLDQALGYYEQYNQLKKELYEAYPNHVEFKNGLAISYQFLGHTHTALGHLDQALQFFEQYNQLEEELYEAYPNHVEFKNGLAISYNWLGWFYEDKLQSLDKAKAYYQKSKLLLEELVASFPDYVEFRKNLEWMKEKL
ncbi:MAG: Photosystem I assembly protein Ycf3 [Haliscomenobacter sp.]|jgi:tetratricopeptide (TPR) repeat protein|nr:Photosystem I assembly protein Ycf3 [Haliscomenobacter sp.]